MNDIPEPNKGTSVPLKADNGGGGPPKTTPKKPALFKKLDLTAQEATEVTPTFLVVKRKGEGDFSKISPFLIDKSLRGCVGVLKSVRKVKDGLLIECMNANQSKKLMDLTLLNDIEVEVTPHAHLNFCKGVITCKDLLNCSVTEIEENLKDQGVTSVKRITIKRNEMHEDTASLILTFNKLSLPQKVKAGIHSLPVRLYIPSPLRCFKCQKFGHTSAKCDKPQICVCGQDLHEGAPCSDPITCVNCGGQHSARSRNCPVFKEETAIQKIRVTERISFAEARKRVRATAPSGPISYAQAARTPAPQVKDIIKQIVPEIVSICVDIVKSKLALYDTDDQTSVSLSREVIKRPSLGGPSSLLAATASTSNAAQNPRETRSTKRKKDSESKSNEDITSGNEASESETSQATYQSKGKRKPGWQKGRSRKKPDKSTQYL